MLKNLVPIAFSLLVIWGTFEAYVAIVVDDGMQYDLEMWKYASKVKEISDNAQIGHQHRPNAQATLMGVNVQTNELGLRDDAVSAEKSEGELRILMLGDSITFGWGVPEPDTVSSQLEKRLNAGGIPATVINTGVGNYNSTMAVEYFMERGRHLNPDIVILNYFINDAEPIPSYDNTFLDRHSKAWVFLMSRLDIAKRKLGLAGKSDWHGYYRDLYFNQGEERGWDSAKKAIQHLARYCKDNGIPLYLVHYPEIREVEPYPFPDITNLLKEHADLLDLPFHDLLPSVKNEDPSSLWVTKPDPHPNAKATHLFAESLTDWLMERELISYGTYGREVIN